MQQPSNFPDVYKRQEFESEKVSITVENSSEFKAGDIGKYLTGFEAVSYTHLDVYKRQG